MNAEQLLNEALGGNMNISTLKPLAWHEIMEGYAQHKIKEEKFTSTNTHIAPVAIGCPCVGCHPDIAKCRKCVADHQRT